MDVDKTSNGWLGRITDKLLRYKIDSGLKAALRCLGIALACVMLFNVADTLSLYIAGVNTTFFNPLMQPVFFYLVLLAPIMFSGFLARWYASAIIVFIGLICSCNIFLALVFSAQLGPDIIDVLDSSSTSETNEFISRFLSFKVILGILSFLAVITMTIRWLFKCHAKVSRLSVVVAIILILPFGLKLTRYCFTEGPAWPTIFNKNLISQVIFNLWNYRSGYQHIKKVVNSPQLPAGIRHLDNSTAGDLLGVVIIGESISRSHMSLYGYPRNTNPQLESMRHNLLVFDNVISPYAQTAQSLLMSFTFWNYSHPEMECSLIALCNAAGINTELISNQFRWGFHDNSTSLLFSKVAWRTYLPEANTRKSIDENIVPVLKQRIESMRGKNVMFLHMIGCHLEYYKRYPEKFAYFNQTRDQITQGLSEKNMKMLNEYDNAMRYNDNVVAEIIKTVATTKHPAFVLYFSDHSEPMMEDGVTCTRNGESLSRYAYEIPFLLWVSPEYQARFPEFYRNLGVNTSQPFQNDNLIWGVLDLLRLRFDGFQEERDIFSPAFKPHPRIIAGKDYDQRYPRKDDRSKMFGNAIKK